MVSSFFTFYFLSSNAIFPGYTLCKEGHLIFIYKNAYLSLIHTNSASNFSNFGVLHLLEWTANVVYFFSIIVCTIYFLQVAA